MIIIRRNLLIFIVIQVINLVIKYKLYNVIVVKVISNSDFILFLFIIFFQFSTLIIIKLKNFVCNVLLNQVICKFLLQIRTIVPFFILINIILFFRINNVCFYLYIYGQLKNTKRIKKKKLVLSTRFLWSNAHRSTRTFLHQSCVCVIKHGFIIIYLFNLMNILHCTIIIVANI